MNIKKFLILINLFLIVLGIVYEPSLSIITNLYNLVVSGDALITDYFISGSKGSAFLNAGIVGLFSIYLLGRYKNQFDGMTIASVMLMSGFALFGKNIINILPILFGTYLYCDFKKLCLGDYLPISFFATSLSPLVSEFAFVYDGPVFLKTFLAFGLGTSVGFIVVFISKHLSKVHKGYNLYNVGFSVGILSTIYVSLLRSYGYKVQSRLLWYADIDYKLYIIFYTLFIGLFIYAALKENFDFSKMKLLLKTSGYKIDYYKEFGLNTVMINMAVNAVFTLTYLLVLQIPLNGATIGGLLTIVGFSAYGKHLFNIYPIFIGVMLGGITKTWTLRDPAVVLSVLFGTGLAPFAGTFGLLAGIIASYINSSVVLNTGFLHGGLNLYNTGFSIGIIASVLVPLFEAIYPDRKNKLADQ